MVSVGSEHGGFIVQVRPRLVGFIRAIIAIPLARKLLFLAVLSGCGVGGCEHSDYEYATLTLGRFLYEETSKARVRGDLALFKVRKGKARGCILVY